METEIVKNNLKAKWNIEPFNFWIPLHGIATDNILYFETENFETYVGYKKLSEIVNEINDGNVFCFNEAREEKVYDKLEIKEYESPDIFYTNKNADWVIYQTHEGTITFAGIELIDKIKSIWNNWKENANPWENQR